jgi:hypothetical protein
LLLRFVSKARNVIIFYFEHGNNLEHLRVSLYGKPFNLMDEPKK